MEVTGNYNQCFVFSNSFFVFFILVSFCLKIKAGARFPNHATDFLKFKINTCKHLDLRKHMKESLIRLDLQTNVDIRIN